MAELPQGTVTFAFTDIEGSTALLKQLGDAYAEVLATHRQLIREAFGAAEGLEIDTQGDAFFYVFVRARDAVAAAVRAQRAHAEAAWPDGASVLVRIGLHTGEPKLSDEGYVGLDVVRAARLCGTCRGGQVLLSQVTRALAGTAMPSGVEVFPLGQRSLKDIDEPEVVYELSIDGLPDTEVTPADPGTAASTHVTPSPPPAPTPTSAPAGPPEPTPATTPEAEPSAGDLESAFDAWANGLSVTIERQVGEWMVKAIDRSGDDPGGDRGAHPKADRAQPWRAQVARLLAELGAVDRSQE
jgi:class 3 adenylate cyclase